MKIRIFYDNTSFRLKQSKKVLKIINLMIADKNKVTGDLSVVISDDETIRRINVEFLKHDYYTDVISFDYTSGNLVNGEIYISIDTVKKNAKNYNVSLNLEIRRVIIHGILHLLGYEDKTAIQKKEIRSAEDFWLDKLK